MGCIISRQPDVNFIIAETLIEPCIIDIDSLTAAISIIKDIGDMFGCDSLDYLPADSFDRDVCSICLDNKDKAIVLDCNHKFHKKCIAEWIKRKDVCPICKTSVLDTI